VADRTKYLTKREWDQFAPLFYDLSYRQCGSYAEAAAEDAGAMSEFVAILQEGNLVGLANIRIKKILFFPFGVAYAHHGPLTARKNEFSDDCLGYCLDALREEYVVRRNLMLRIIPPFNGGYWLDAQAACLEKRGLRRSARYKARETFVLDLTKSLPDIRKNFDPKWRRDLSKAERSNVKVTMSDALADFDRFEPLLLDLIDKKGFTPARDAAFFRRVQSGAEPYERMVVHLAWHDGELVAGHVGSFAGNTVVYLLGASNSKGRDLRASYLLQWAVIELAKSLGKCYYDLGGIDQHANPDVYRFKKRLNGRHVIEIGSYELAAGVLAKSALHFLEDAYGVLSRLSVRPGTY
jgi:lipid II:glycine glycyltransferase (peptidoglycan interpeptide bridge formation enzyme)